MNTWCCLLSSFRDIWDTENPIQIDTTNTFRVVLLEAITMMTAVKTKKMCPLKLNCVYVNPFDLSNEGDFFWSWILKDCIKVQNKRRKRPVCHMFTSSIKCQGVVMQWMSRKCTKQRDACAELLFCSKNQLFFWRFRCCGFLSFLVPFALQKDEPVIPSHHQVNCNCCQHNSGHTTNNNDSDKEILWLLCFHWRLRPSTFHIFALQVIKKHFPLEFGHRVFWPKGSCLTALWLIWFLWEVKEPTARFKLKKVGAVDPSGVGNHSLAGWAACKERTSYRNNLMILL